MFHLVSVGLCIAVGAGCQPESRYAVVMTSSGDLLIVAKRCERKDVRGIAIRTATERNKLVWSAEQQGSASAIDGRLVDLNNLPDDWLFVNGQSPALDLSLGYYLDIYFENGSKGGDSFGPLVENLASNSSGPSDPSEYCGFRLYEQVRG